MKYVLLFRINYLFNILVKAIQYREFLVKLNFDDLTSLWIQQKL